MASKLAESPRTYKCHACLVEILLEVARPANPKLPQNFHVTAGIDTHDSFAVQKALGEIRLAIPILIPDPKPAEVSP